MILILLWLCAFFAALVRLPKINQKKKYIKNNKLHEHRDQCAMTWLNQFVQFVYRIHAG